MEYDLQSPIKTGLPFDLVMAKSMNRGIDLTEDSEATFINRIFDA